MLKCKWVLALLMILVLGSSAHAQAPSPWPQSGTITLSGQQVPYTFLVKGPSYVYYRVNLPTLTLGPIGATLGLPISSAQTAAQAQALIQARASLYWGSLKLPLPY